MPAPWCYIRDVLMIPGKPVLYWWPLFRDLLPVFTWIAWYFELCWPFIPSEEWRNRSMEWGY